MTPTLPTEGSQERMVLDRLLSAHGGWISKRVFVYEMGLTQAGRAINVLENRFHWKIEHSPFTDSKRFKSYRILQEARTLTLL